MIGLSYYTIAELIYRLFNHIHDEQLHCRLARNLCLASSFVMRYCNSVMVSRLDTDECLNNAVYLLIQQLWEQGEMVSMTFSSLTRE